jgi:Flp pilus assembly protein TadG
MRRGNRKLRRGGAAIEFAMTAPLLITILSGVIEWGWYLFQLQMVLNAVADGVRAGSRTAVSADPDPAEVAAARTAQRLVDLDVVSSLSAAKAVVTATQGGTSAVPEITVTIDMDIEPLIGLIPTPSSYYAKSTLLIEDSS